MQHLITSSTSPNIHSVYDAIDWPKGTKLIEYDLTGAKISKLFKTQDIVDQTMLRKSHYTFRLGVSIINKNWIEWNVSTLTAIEAYLKYAFEFEALSVSIKRPTKTPDKCTNEMIWELAVKPS